MSDSVPLPPDVDRAVPALSIYVWVGCGIATAVVATRLYTRLVLVKTAGWDDLFIALSYVFAVGLYAGTAVLIAHGYGRHLIYLDMADVIVLLKWNVAVNIMGFTSLMLSRTSIGLFLLRLVYPIQKLAIPVYVVLAINTLQAVCLIVWTGLRCVPLKKEWEPSAAGFCINGNRFTIVDRTFACLNVLVDLSFAIYPVFILKRLQVKLRVRLAVYLLLSCGLLAAVASIGRVVASDLTVEDITYDLIPLTYWAISEVTGVLILGSLPAFHSLGTYISRTDAWKTLSSRLGSEMAKSKFSSKLGQELSGDVTHDSHHGHSDGLVSSDRDVQVRQDVYLEFTDRSSDKTPTARAFRDESSGLHFGQGETSAEII
nr:hypothetical protein CFP56_76004 [Quercus suber]